MSSINLLSHDPDGSTHSDTRDRPSAGIATILLSDILVRQFYQDKRIFERLRKLAIPILGPELGDFLQHYEDVFESGTRALGILPSDQQTESPR
jgi:hypothetical protein